MPRKSRLDLRKEAEIAEKAPKKATKKKKAAKKRTTRKTKEMVLERRRLVWVIYSANLKEDSRYPYEQRKEAEERLEQLKSKSKRTYFIQPVKEVLSGEKKVTAEVPEDDDVEEEVLNNEEAEDNDNDDEEDQELPEEKDPDEFVNDDDQ